MGCFVKCLITSNGKVSLRQKLSNGCNLTVQRYEFFTICQKGKSDFKQFFSYSLFLFEDVSASQVRHYFWQIDQISPGNGNF